MNTFLVLLGWLTGSALLAVLVMRLVLPPMSRTCLCGRYETSQLAEPLIADESMIHSQSKCFPKREYMGDLEEIDEWEDEEW